MKSAHEALQQAPAEPEAPGKKADRRTRSPRTSAPGKQFSVVHLTAEYWPFAQAGGLAEAVRGLAEFQTASGKKSFVMLPLYRGIRETIDLVPVTDACPVPLGPTLESAR